MFLWRASVCASTSEPALDTQFCICLFTLLRCCKSLSISASLPSPCPSPVGAFPTLRNVANFTSSSLSSFLACTSSEFSRQISTLARIIHPELRSCTISLSFVYVALPFFSASSSCINSWKQRCYYKLHHRAEHECTLQICCMPNKRSLSLGATSGKELHSLSPQG